MEPIVLTFWEVIAIVIACVVCSGGFAWLLYDMQMQIKLWDEKVKSKIKDKK